MTTIGWNENFERKGRQTTSDSRFAIASSPSESDVHALTDLLSELQCLLEDYAPAWYNEDLHNRIDAAVRAAGPR